MGSASDQICAGSTEVELRKKREEKKKKRRIKKSGSPPWDRTGNQGIVADALRIRKK